MQVITSIYLNCRPDLRDEWLTGNEVDDLGEGQVQILFRIDAVIIGTNDTFITGTGAGAPTTCQILLR
jgi:hypothetical protein